VLAAQPVEPGDEPPPVGVQRGLVRRAGDPATSEHHRVEVPGERHPVQAAPPVRAEYQAVEVVVVEVAVGHAHRLAAVRPHDQQRRCVVVGRQQCHLSADQLGVRARTTQCPQHRHRRLHLLLGVRAVHPHPVGVARVVTRGAGQVAWREHAVGALAAHREAAQRLTGRPHDLRQLRPSPCHRCDELGIGGSRGALPSMQPFQRAHRHLSAGGPRPGQGSRAVREGGQATRPPPG